MSQATLSEILWQQAIGDNNFAQAEKVYQHLLKTNEATIEQHSVMGLWYQQKQEHTKAIQAFQTALKSAPYLSDELHYQIALCYFETEHYHVALRHLELSLKHSPTYADAIYLYAETLALLEFKPEAILQFKRLLSLVNDDVQLCISIAASLSELGEKDDAIEIYHRALLLEPENYYLFSNLGVEYAELGEYTDALYCHERALVLNNFCGDLWYNLACTYSQMSMLNPALDALEKAINLDPANKEYARYDDELSLLHSNGRFWKLIEQ